MDIVEQYLDEHGEVETLIRSPKFDEHVEGQRRHARFDEVLEVHEDYLHTEFFYNEGHLEGEPGRAAAILMLGYTRGGKFLCVPIEPTGRHSVWRAITAYQPDSDYLEQMYLDYRNS